LSVDVIGRNRLRLLFLKPLALMTALCAVVVLTMAVVFATLAVPINVLGHDVTWATGGAWLMGGHLDVVVTSLVVATLIAICFILALTQRTSTRSGDAGGHVYRRSTAVGHDKNLARGSVVIHMFFSAMMTAMAWASEMLSFGRPCGHSFAV
jgi:uncharacterized membrane protein